MDALFACSKCFKRFPFEELSEGKQICKNCQAPAQLGKCHHCRQECPATSKGKGETVVCKNCESKISRYGQPKACSVCNFVSAFGSSKCGRCSHYEKKYGPPRQCDECKQKSAFDKPDEKNMLNGKRLCWVCLASFKKSLRKSSDPLRKRKLSGKDSSRGSLSLSSTPTPAKMNRVGSLKSSSNTGGDEGDPSSSDHMATIAHLREEIANLSKQITSKDQQLLSKDKLVTELRAQVHNIEQQSRQKMKHAQKLHDDEMNDLRLVTKDLQLKVATLSKQTKNKGVAVVTNSNNNSQNNSPDA